MLAAAFFYHPSKKVRIKGRERKKKQTNQNDDDAAVAERIAEQDYPLGLYELQSAILANSATFDCYCSVEREKGEKR